MDHLANILGGIVLILFWMMALGLLADLFGF